MSYTDLTVIVDGALDMDDQIFSDVLLDMIVSRIHINALFDGQPTEIFLLYHDHDPLGESDECSCVQYLTDHKPQFSWNVGD